MSNSKTEVIGGRTSKKNKKWLEDRAAQEDRSESYLIDAIVTQARESDAGRKLQDKQRPGSLRK